MPATNSRGKYEKCLLWLMFFKIRRTWSFHIFVIMFMRCTEIYKQQTLFCSLNPLFGDILIAVAIMVCLKILMRILSLQVGQMYLIH